MIIVIQYNNNNGKYGTRTVIYNCKLYIIVII